MKTARPVHILSGFLGTGKTTLLNRLLQRSDFSNTLVIVNEFGQVPLDHHLIESSSETIVELSNGCLCCSIRGELVDTLISVSRHAFDRIIIETTGIADPLPVHQALTMQPVLAGGLRAGSILSVFDTVHGANLIHDHEEANRQIALADFVFLSMQDRAEDLNHAEEIISKVNPTATILKDPSDISAEVLDNARFVEKEGLSGNHSGHYVSLVLESDQSQPISAIVGFLHHLAGICGPSLLRVKGFAFVNEYPQGPLLIQMSGQIVHDPVELDQWPKNHPQTQLVVIAKEIEAEIIQSVFNSFFGIADIDTPDRQALTKNPLAIPGM